MNCAAWAQKHQKSGLGHPMDIDEGKVVKIIPSILALEI